MFTALIIVEVLISILLIIAVLMQASKGGGLAGTFGGGQVGSMFGVRRTADFLSNFSQPRSC
jgi:preprotein translocase subunit SecG